LAVYTLATLGVQADYMHAAEVGTISFGGALKEQ
jgi:hypothetical protein